MSGVIKWSLRYFYLQLFNLCHIIRQRYNDYFYIDSDLLYVFFLQINLSVKKKWLLQSFSVTFRSSSFSVYCTNRRPLFSLEHESKNYSSLEYSE